MFSLSLISLIAGAVSVPCAFLALLGGAAFVPLLFALGGLALGALGLMREKDKNGMALLGVACSVLGLIITIICFACSGCAVCRYGALVNEALRYMS